MDDTAVFKLTYGLFYLGVENNGKQNVCVVNTVSQVTAAPQRVTVAVLKSNLTGHMIEDSKKFSVCVMGVNASMETIQHFGGQSGHDVDKLLNQSYELDIQKNPMIIQGCIATFSCKVIQTIDLDTHFLFIADIVDAKVLSKDIPMTYKDYRDIKAGIKKQSEINPSTPQKDIWQCDVCHYVYDGDIPFEDLPDDYICPVCKQPKSVFKKA